MTMIMCIIITFGRLKEGGAGPAAQFSNGVAVGYLWSWAHL